MSPLTWILLGLAVLLAPPREPSRAAPPTTGGLALAVDLTAAGLRSGRRLGAALARAAPAAPAPIDGLLAEVAALDRLGASAAEAWSAVPRDGPLGELARVAVRSADSGLRLAAGMERLAAELRAEQVAAAAVRAHRAGVLAVGPLAACFLPSFVCLGVIPVVVGVAHEVAGGLLTGR